VREVVIDSSAATGLPKSIGGSLKAKFGVVTLRIGSGDGAAGSFEVFS